MRNIICALAFTLLFVGPDAFSRNVSGLGTGIIAVSCDPEVRRCD